MTLRIELDATQRAQLEATAQQLGMTVEEFAKMCVAERLLAEPVGSARRAWALGQGVFGSFQSGGRTCPQTLKGHSATTSTLSGSNPC